MSRVRWGRGAGCRNPVLGVSARLLPVTLLALLALPLSASFGESARSVASAKTAHVVDHLNGRNISLGYRLDFTRSTRLRRATVAAAPSVNSRLRPFKLDFIYNRNPARPGTLQLTGFYLFPFYLGPELGPFGGCVQCAGSGHFGDSHWGSIAPFARKFGHTPSELGIPKQFVNHTYSSVAHGSIFMTSRTRFIQAAIGPFIGNFGVYGLNVGKQKLVKLRGGCIPAYLDWYASISAVNNFVLHHVSDLPTVPCNQAVPPGNHLAISAPAEFSSTGPVTGRITGHATGTQWLIVFQQPANKIKRNEPACLPNALAELGRTVVSFQRQVSGNFIDTFTTAPASSPGFLCAYLQLGGRLLQGNQPWPDGRVSATAVRPFYAGDSLSISGATSASPGQQVSETVTGRASTRQMLYVFAPFSPCASSAQAEYAQDPHDLSVAKGPGAFSYGVTITIASRPPPTVHFCAYLQNGAPVNGMPTGLTIRAASQTISIVGAAADRGASAFGRLSPNRLAAR